MTHHIHIYRYAYRLLTICTILLCASCGSFFGRSQPDEITDSQAAAQSVNVVPTFTTTPAANALDNSADAAPVAEPTPTVESRSAPESASETVQDTTADAATGPASTTDAGANTSQAASLPSNAQQISAQTIYGDGLSETWQDWSWSVSTDYASLGQIQSGGAAMAVTFDQAWGALYLHVNASLARDDYDALRFWIHGGDAGGQKLRLVLADENDAFQEEAVEVTAQAQTWTPVEIPLAQLGNVRFINGMAWQDASGDSQPTLYLDQIELIDLDLPPTPTPQPQAGPALTVDVAADRHPINPDIYGINYADEALAQELKLPVRRWGGNATTRYNWQVDAASRAADWFFENHPEENENPEALPSGSAADRFVEQDRRTGTKTMLTVPLIGWTAKDREVRCGFSIAKYGPQQEADPWQPDCGNGIDGSGNPITNNDPSDTSLTIDPGFVREWIAHLTARFGAAAAGGVAYYSLDNEPMLWNHTHRDVHPEPVGYDELRDRSYAYGAAVKQADPSAQTLGPALWGWTAYFFSALDQAAGSGWLNSTPDRAAHGGIDLVPWYLQQMRAYEEQNGVRILDYLDLHFYPQGAGVALSPAGGAETQALRLRSTRTMWDISYMDESWIAEPVRLIPRMHEWVEQNYPGTKLALTEYNWGALDHINGALAQADLLGIFGRERLDLATLWAALDVQDPFAYAFRMYRNYDGAGSQFGDISVQATSADQDALSIYAAERSADGALTIIVINKSNFPLTTALTIANAQLTGNVQVYRYSAAHSNIVMNDVEWPRAEGVIQADFPSSSISLLVIPQARE